MKRKLSRDERMGSQERRTAVLRLLSRMELLEAELRSCADAQRKEEIKSEMRVLRRDQKNLSVKKGKPKKHVVPLPQSYLEKRKETREAAAGVSERHKIKAQFVMFEVAGKSLSAAWASATSLRCRCSASFTSSSCFWLASTKAAS